MRQEGRWANGDPWSLWSYLLTFLGLKPRIIRWCPGFHHRMAMLHGDERRQRATVYACQDCPFTADWLPTDK